MSLPEATTPSGAPAAERTDLPPIPAETYCPDCGYDLRGLTGERCPECGFSLDVVRAGGSTQIPWCYRQRLGRFRAYWRTVWLVGQHPRRFYLEMVRPVSYRGSQSFRWVTFLHAWMPFVAAPAVWYLFSVLGGPGISDMERWILWSVPMVFGLALAVAPGLMSYRFQHRRLPIEVQNRAIALSYYARAPMAVASLAIVPLSAAVVLYRAVGFSWVDRLTLALGFALVAGTLHIGSFFLGAIRVRHLGRSALRAYGVNYLVWPLWLYLLFSLTMLGILVLPLIVFYLLVIWHSLR